MCTNTSAVRMATALFISAPTQPAMRLAPGLLLLRLSEVSVLFSEGSVFSYHTDSAVPTRKEKLSNLASRLAVQSEDNRLK